MRRRVIAALACIATAALVLNACAPHTAPDGLMPTNNKGKDAAAEIAWSPDADCSSCHAEQTDAAGTSNETHSSLGVGCTSCHNKQDLKSVHEEHGDSGRTATKLRYTAVGNNGCLAAGCHDSVDALTAATSNVQIADDFGTSKNPHEMLGQKGHEDLACTDCHSLHKKEDTMAQATQTCFGCHHARKFECGTCHT